MALRVSGQTCELREVVLSNKPAEMIAASLKATVPVLVDTDGRVIDESYDIMTWALSRCDPEGWMEPSGVDVADMQKVIETIDGPFKHHLDRYKYADRYAHENDGAGVEPVVHRDAVMLILQSLEDRLADHDFLFGVHRSLADVATAPFVRQFARVDVSWFSAQPLPRLQKWLADFVGSELFVESMKKYPPWQSGEPGVHFPD